MSPYLPKKKSKEPEALTKKKSKEPVTDTRTAEEIDASYRRNLALFMKVDKEYNQAFKSKMNQIKAAIGGTNTVYAKNKQNTIIEESKEEKKRAAVINKSVGKAN